jgi:hypothetical protein
VAVKILMYEFSNFWWGFEVARLLTWPGYLPITLGGRVGTTYIGLLSPIIGSP